MKITRSSYLVNRVFRQYILINIFTSLALTLGVIVDGIIVGNLLGQEALTAITLSMPFIQIIATLSALINGGSSVLASIEIGKGNIDKVKQIFTTAMFLNLISGVCICLLGIAYIDTLVEILCSVESLRPLVKSYLLVVVYASPIYMLLPGLCAFIRIDSSPKIVFISLAIANIINMALGYTFIKFFGLGIASSSMASVISFGIAFVIALSHFRKKERLLSISTFTPINEWYKPLIIGLPIAIESFLASFTLLFINNTVGLELGVLGLSILAVCFNTLILSNLFTRGVLQTIQPLCGVLFGNKDDAGMRFSIRTAFIFLLTCLSLVTIFIEFFPFQFASLFGVDDYDQYHTISDAIRIFSLAIPISGIVILFSSIYIIIRKKIQAFIITIINSLIIIPTIYILKDFEGNYIWYSFVISQIIAFLCILLLKIPAISENKSNFHNILDVSLNNTGQHIKIFHEKLTVFLTSIQCSEVLDERILEIHSDILKNVNPSSGWRYIDITIKVNDGIVTFISKDDAPYNTEYSWVLGQNTRLINYKLKD